MKRRIVVAVILISVALVLDSLRFHPGGDSPAASSMRIVVVMLIGLAAFRLADRGVKSQSPTGGPAGPGMVDPMQIHAEWVQRQRNRWDSPSFRVLWFGMAAATVAIMLIGVVSRISLIVAVSALIAAGLGRDWWRYAPRSHPTP